MTCNRFKTAAHDYFLGHLTPERMAQEDAHVAACGDCRSFLAVCREISCRDLVEFLNEYVDDELPPERRGVFERHLTICDDCRRYVEQYRSVMNLSALAFAAPGAPTLPPVPEALVRAILDARARQDRG
jgi:anti-sigma factor RsiW